MTIYELRIYTTLPGRMPALLSRFENHTLRIWDKYNIKQVGFWTTLIGPNCGNELTYLLAWDSLADREAKFNSFCGDAEWLRVKEESERGGAINERVSSSILSPTGFSALQ